MLLMSRDESPSWYKQRLGSLLAACLLEPGGVFALLTTMAGDNPDGMRSN